MTDSHAEEGLILAQREHGVLTLTINRPRQKNALNPFMYDELRRQLLLATEDADTHVVMLSGSDGIFCAGTDVKSLDKIRNLAWNERPGYRFMSTLAQFPKPVVAVVTGDAIGIGMTLLLHCDLVYALAEARFRAPFVALGVVPEFASTFLLPRLAGHPKAASVLLLGETLTAQQAYELGLVGKVLERDSLIPAARRAALQLASAPPDVVQTTKRLLRAPLMNTVTQTIDTELSEFCRLLASPDSQARFATLRDSRS